jgi:hypothetical protein
MTKRMLKKQKELEIVVDLEKEEMKLLPINTPLCKGCKNVDIRSTKDTLIYALHTVYIVASMLEVNEIGWEKTCNALRKLARDKAKIEARKRRARGNNID